jgi:trans-aconitate methyltransferase
MTPQVQGVKEAYDEHFVLDNKLTLEWYPQRVAELSAGASMLELGLGHGYSTSYFAQRFRPYVVIEGSAEMITRFRERFAIADVRIEQGYFEDFTTDRRFHNIVMGFVLEHVDDPTEILCRYRELLVPGGSVFVAVPNAESLHRRFGHAAGLLPDITALSQADLDFGHRRYFTVRTLSQLVEASGYSIQRIEGLFLKPITTQQISDLRLPPATLQAMMIVGVDYPELCNSILMQLRPA